MRGDKDELLHDSEPQMREAGTLIFDDLLSIKGGAGDVKTGKDLISGPVQALASDSMAEMREALAEHDSGSTCRRRWRRTSCCKNVKRLKRSKVGLASMDAGCEALGLSTQVRGEG